MDKRWDLTVLYRDFDDAEFISDKEALRCEVSSFKEFSDSCEGLADAELALEFVRRETKIREYSEKLFIYSNLRNSADTKDARANSNMGEIMEILSGVSAPEAKLSKLIAKMDNLERIIETDPLLESHRYFLLNIKRDSKYLLSDGEEELFARMDISGASAWNNLHAALTSGVTARFDGKDIPLSSVRNLAYDKDQNTRQRAYEAELECYGKIKDAVAFSLNSIKLQVLTECSKRGYASPLEKTLYTSRMKRETLDALILAMEEYLPVFRKYLKYKAKALGHEGGLPWYDLFAPMGSNDKVYTAEDAKEYLLKIFEGFDRELHDMVKEAFENNWIDFYPREGKVGGAFDCAVPSAKVSRVLTNFDGSFSDVVTLAHELGHSFHDRQIFAHTPLNQDYSMPVAETASTFNEVLVMNEAIAKARDKEEKLALIEGQLMDACQIITDIYARYTFETSVFEHRPTEFMDADRLCSLMLEAEEKAYGDGLDKDIRHPYMWLCKGHYYSGSLSFYNFPYAFGGLFARGLFAKYKREGDAFVKTYKEMLRATSVTDIEECAKIAGIDLTSPDFWRAGLETIAEEIEEFCALVCAE